MNLLTLREVAAALKLSERGVRKQTAAGRFGPAVLKIGRSVRVRADEFGAWVAAGCPQRDRWTWPAVAERPRKAAGR